MATLKVRQARSAARRDTIIAAAITVFGRKGVHAATLTDVAREASVPLSSLYDYFENKTRLLAALPEAIFAGFFEDIQGDIDAAEDAADKLEIFFVHTLDYMERNPDWARVFFLEIWPTVIAGEPEIRRAVDAFGRKAINIVEEGVEAGHLSRDTDPYLVMSIVLGTMAHLVSVWLLYGRPYDLRRQGRRAMTMMRRAIERGPDA